MNEFGLKSKITTQQFLSNSFEEIKLIYVSEFIRLVLGKIHSLTVQQRLNKSTQYVTSSPVSTSRNATPKNIESVKSSRTNLVDEDLLPLTKHKQWTNIPIDDFHKSVEAKDLQDNESLSGNENEESMFCSTPTRRHSKQWNSPPTAKRPNATLTIESHSYEAKENMPMNILSLSNKSQVRNEKVDANISIHDHQIKKLLDCIQELRNDVQNINSRLDGFEQLLYEYVQDRSVEQTSNLHDFHEAMGVEEVLIDENDPNELQSLGDLHIAVLGAGQMGCGIAQVVANQARFSVLIMDQNKSQIEKGMKLIEKLLEKDVSKGRITAQDKVAVLGNIKTTTNFNDFANADFVIEAATENVELKQRLFRELDGIVKANAILATNTSSISITKIAAVTKRPHKVIGMHFMNPVPVMKLVEIIPGLATDLQTIDETLALAKKMEKVTTVSKDMPGFIANRLLMPYINEAVFALQENIGSREDIDTTMKLGTNMPMGPLTLGDFIGLDTCLAIMNVLHTQLGDSKYRPAPLLQNYVNAGWVGKKVGRGFYQY